MKYMGHVVPVSVSYLSQKSLIFGRWITKSIYGFSEWYKQRVSQNHNSGRVVGFIIWSKEFVPPWHCDSKIVTKKIWNITFQICNKNVENPVFMRVSLLFQISHAKNCDGLWTKLASLQTASDAGFQKLSQKFFSKILYLCGIQTRSKNFVTACDSLKNLFWHKEILIFTGFLYTMWQLWQFNINQI